MLKSYLRLSLRNLLANTMYSAINITGLAAGMAVALLIGLWIYDEKSYDSYHRNHNELAQVMVNVTAGSDIITGPTTSIPMGMELHNKYSADTGHRRKENITNR